MGLFNPLVVQTGKQWVANTKFAQGTFIFPGAGENYPASTANANRGVYLEVTGVAGDSESGGTTPFTATMTPGAEITNGDLTLVVRQNQSAQELADAIDANTNSIISPITDGGLVNGNANLRKYTGTYQGKLPQTNGIIRFEEREKDLLIYEAFDSNEGNLSLHAFQIKGPNPNTITAQQAWDNANLTLENQKLIDGNEAVNNVNGSELNGMISGDDQGWYLLDQNVNLNTTNDVSFNVLLRFTETGGANTKRASVFRMTFSLGKLTGNPIGYPLSSLTALLGLDMSGYESYKHVDTEKIQEKFNG